MDCVGMISRLAVYLLIALSFVSLGLPVTIATSHLQLPLVTKDLFYVLGKFFGLLAFSIFSLTSFSMTSFSSS